MRSGRESQHALGAHSGPVRISVAYGNIPAPGLEKVERARQESLQIVCGCLAASVAVKKKSKVSKTEPKGTRREAKGSKKQPKWSQKGAKVTKKKPKGSKKEPK